MSTGLIAHVVMGGALPGVLGLLPALVASTLLGLAFLYKPTLVGVLSTTLLSQAVFHHLASLGSQSVAVVHHHEHAAPLVGHMTVDLPMSAGHLIAAIITAAGVLGAHRVRVALSRVRALLSNWWSVSMRLAPVVVSLTKPQPVSEFFQRVTQTPTVWTPCGLRAPPTFSHI